LSDAEIRSAVTLLRNEGAAAATTRFAQIRLAAPDKKATWDWTPRQKVQRHAFVVMSDRGEVSEALVDLTAKRLVRLEPKAAVQTAITGEEWNRATKLVKADRRWQAAMAARGITDVRPIFCDALSIGSRGAGEKRRLLYVPCYDARGTRNVYGRPIEGLMALVDVGAGSVIQVTDSRPVPISKADPSLEQERQETLRPALKPVISSSPGGRNFSIDGAQVRWAAWSFHLSFDQRVGQIISTLRYRDGERHRPVLYQGHVSEMFVPYMDPDPNWSFRSYMDVGEYGFGTLASKLVAGADCPADAVLLSPTLPNVSGEPYRASNVMCAFERNSTVPLWRRSELVTGSHEVRQDLEFVIRSIPAVGNYDYVYDWVFTLKGEVRIEVGATGIAAAKGVAAVQAQDVGGRAGALVAPNLVAPYHDHFLSFRLDLDVDGPKNRFMRDRLQSRVLSPGADRRSVWEKNSQVSSSEIGLAPSHQPELWRVESAGARTSLGHAPSFEVSGGHNAASLLTADDPPQSRAAFSSRPLWVTAYKPSEIYAAGDYPNQGNGGEGLPRFVDGETISNEDLVVWYTMGFHHVTRPEDWPVLPTVRHGVALRPHGFFDRNPAMDVRREFEPTVTPRP
jgi:primary-amine oxidase